MASVNTIGGISVLQFRGDPNPPQELLETIKRPGVDYAVFRRVGIIGRPFQLESFCDFLNQAAAQTALQSYGALVGTAVALVVDGVSFSPLSAVIHMVEPMPPIKGVSSFVGGLNVPPGGYAHILRARWTLELTT